MRQAADIRTMAYLGAAAALTIFNWNFPGHLLLYPFTLFFFFSTAVISHNHNHLGIWRSRTLNLVTSHVITFFYGHPAIAWVPTHNQIHHRLNNRPGDSSRSPKLFRRNHLAALLVYPVLTNAAQTRDIRDFLRDLWSQDRRSFWEAASQYLVFFGVMAVLLVADWRKTLVYVVIPQQVAIYLIQCVNYLQHVDTDAFSEWNHSRNFVGLPLNALLFNNGYHTVHHLKPGVHWSVLPQLHAQHADKIDPSLLQRSVPRYIGYTFFLRPLLGGKASAAANV